MNLRLKTETQNKWDPNFYEINKTKRNGRERKENLICQPLNSLILVI